MISIEKIKKDFKYIEDKENGDIFGGVWQTDDNKMKFELFFNSKLKEIEYYQINNFENFIDNKEKISTEIETYIISNFSDKQNKDYDKIINGTLTFDIVTVLNEIEDYDIELICSKNYKTLFSKKRVDFVVAIEKGKIKEILEMN